MARIAGAADMGMSIGKLVASGNSAERRAAKSEFSGLVHRVRQANLLDHRPRAYAVKAVHHCGDRRYSGGRHSAQPHVVGGSVGTSSRCVVRSDRVLRPRCRP